MKIKRNEALIKARKKTGMTQKQVADLAGISEVSYQRLEYNQQSPTLRTAIRIADILKVENVRTLWDGNPTNNRL